MGCKGGSIGVMAEIELNKVSEEIKELINQIETDFEIDIEAFNAIRENLKLIKNEKDKNQN